MTLRQSGNLPVCVVSFFTRTKLTLVSLAIKAHRASDILS